MGGTPHNTGYLIRKLKKFYLIMSKKNHTITEEEFYKDTGVNLKGWNDSEKNNKEEIKTIPAHRKILDYIIVYGIFLLIIGLIIFSIWGFFFYKDYRGSSDPNDFVPDYMGGVN